MADELLMSLQDCLSLDKEDNVLCLFMVFSREEQEHDVSLGLGGDEDACSAAYFAHIKSKRIK